MTQTSLESCIRKAVHFGVGPAFEINYALSVLTDDRARIHTGWKRSALRRLPSSFKAALKRSGGHPIAWMMVPDAYPVMRADVSFDEAVAALESVPPAVVRRESLVGLIHDSDHVDELISRSASLADVIAAVPKEKYEWLMHVGIYPYDPASPAVRVVERLISDPDGFHSDIVELLKRFWERVFRDTWTVLRPQLQRSVEETERLFAASTFAELADALRLRIEVNERRRYLRAIRGGDLTKVDDLDACWILPSAFNDNRYWYSRLHNGAAITAYFPYFDPRISLGLNDPHPADIDRVAEPELDPALIFKALGNTTRYAVAGLLAQRPRSAADLAEALSLTKPTISHHVHLLREAGLLDETPKGGSVVLSLRSGTLDRLSTMTLENLFGGATSEKLRRNAP